LLDGTNTDQFLVSIRRDALSESLPEQVIQKMIYLLLLVLNHQQTKHSG
jgi:hypothetical protein